MMDLLRRLRFLSLLSIVPSVFQCAPCFAAEAQSSAQKYRLVTAIADYYVKSLPSEGSFTKEVVSKKRAAHEAWPVNLGERTRREVVFNRIFTKSEKCALLQKEMSPVLNEYAWKDLRLFYGTTSAPAYHLMSRINRTVTALGEGALATLLVTPTSKIEEVFKRQHLIQTFLDSTEEVDRLKASLRHYQEAEQSVLSLWTPTDPLYTKEYKKYMDNHFYTKDDESANKNVGWLELRKRFFRDFLGIQYYFLWPVVRPLGQEISGLIIKRKLGTALISRERLRRGWIGAIPYYGGWYQWSRDKSRFSTIYHVAVEAYYTWTAYQGISNYLEYSSVLRSLSLRMADVQKFVTAASDVSACIAASPTLEAAYGARLASIRNLLAQDQEQTDLGRLVRYLKTLPYNHWSYFFNNAGRLLASHKLFTEYKDYFADAMYELGELDAFVGITTLMQEARDYPATHAYVFTTLLDRSQQQNPYIKLEEMWNPFLDAKIAVGNSVLMDAAGGTSNIILTGPNAGGKSTFLTGVATSLLLSQTFGIAPAREATLTPFDNINTFIDISDDIAAGKSLFMAEVDRAQKHIARLEGLLKDEFSFSIFDEPFSGTNPTEGGAAEYAILEAMADYSNTLNIVATHYPIVMLLEKNAPEKGFVNYMVYITYQGAKKRLKYTYKVIPGKSNQAIAIDILEEAGYDTKLLQRAREIIAHPERYPASF